MGRARVFVVLVLCLSTLDGPTAQAVHDIRQAAQRDEELSGRMQQLVSVLHKIGVSTTSGSVDITAQCVSSTVVQFVLFSLLWRTDQLTTDPDQQPSESLEFQSWTDAALTVGVLSVAMSFMGCAGGSMVLSEIGLVMAVVGLMLLFSNTSAMRTASSHAGEGRIARAISQRTGKLLSGQLQRLASGESDDLPRNDGLGKHAHPIAAMHVEQD